MGTNPKAPPGVDQKDWNIYIWPWKETDVKETIYGDCVREFAKEVPYILKRELNNTDTPPL